MVQKEILEKYPKAPIQVYVVWFSMLPTDSRSEYKPNILPDFRVTHYWDEERLVGQWFGQNDQLGKSATLGGVAWDIIFFYGPEAHWDNAPQPLLSYARPIIAYHYNFSEKLLPLLE